MALRHTTKDPEYPDFLKIGVEFGQRKIEVVDKAGNQKKAYDGDEYE